MATLVATGSTASADSDFESAKSTANASADFCSTHTCETQVVGQVLNCNHAAIVPEDCTQGLPGTAPVFVADASAASVTGGAASGTLPASNTGSTSSAPGAAPSDTLQASPTATTQSTPLTPGTNTVDDSPPPDETSLNTTDSSDTELPPSAPTTTQSTVPAPSAPMLALEADEATTGLGIESSSQATTGPAQALKVTASTDGVIASTGGIVKIGITDVQSSTVAKDQAILTTSTTSVAVSYSPLLATAGSEIYVSEMSLASSAAYATADQTAQACSGELIGGGQPC